jgi:phosphoserine phosphatase
MRLVIQGPNLTSRHLEEIASLLHRSEFVEIAPQAMVLEDVEFTPQVAHYCHQQSLDFGFVPTQRRLDHIGLVVMDMDSTLINIECIDEIADMQGLKPEVAAITESAMRGEIDFSQSLRKRVGLLTGLGVDALQRVYEERLQLNPGAEFLIATLKQRGIRTLLVSGGFTFFTDRLKARLGLDYAQSNTLEIVDGKLTGRVLGDIVDAQGKAMWLARVRDELGLGKDQVIAIGDGANDLLMMNEAVAGIAYHAKPVVQEKATYALNHVGLEGVVNLLS